MLFEFRADRADSLSAIKQEVFGIIEDFSREHPLSVRLLGARPSMGEVDPVAMQRLIREISDLIEAETGASLRPGLRILIRTLLTKFH